MADGTPEAPSTPAREGGPRWTGLGPGQCRLLAQQLPKTENLPLLSAQPYHFLLQEDLLATPKGRNLFVLQAWAFLSWSHLDLPLSTLPGVFPSTWGRMASDAAPRHSAHSQGLSQTESTGRGVGGKTSGTEVNARVLGSALLGQYSWRGSSHWSLGQFSSHGALGMHRICTFKTSKK